MLVYFLEGEREMADREEVGVVIELSLISLFDMYSYHLFKRYFVTEESQPAYSALHVHCIYFNALLRHRLLHVLL